MDYETLLLPEELDAIGEIGNISMGAAATALSVLLNCRVSITSPVSQVMTKQELSQSFKVPHLLIQVEYSQGLEGIVLLVMGVGEVAVLADLMMGGDGVTKTEGAAGLTELDISAASEVMNQMIGSSSMSMADVFNRRIDITPPVTRIVDRGELVEHPLPVDDMVLTVKFRIMAGDIIDSCMMQVVSLPTAKAQASFLLSGC